MSQRTEEFGNAEGVPELHCEPLCSTAALWGACRWGPVHGQLVPPKAVSYHAGVQIFQALHLSQVLHCEDGALHRLLLSHLHLKGVLLGKRLATPAEMVSLEGRHMNTERRGHHMDIGADLVGWMLHHLEDALRTSMLVTATQEIMVVVSLQKAECFQQHIMYHLSKYLDQTQISRVPSFY